MMAGWFVSWTFEKAYNHLNWEFVLRGNEEKGF